MYMYGDSIPQVSKEESGKGKNLKQTTQLFTLGKQGEGCLDEFVKECVNGLENDRHLLG